MAGPILVTYGSWCGSTAEVAEEIGRVLREGGSEVEVVRADRAGDVGRYSAAVIGTAIRAGRCKGEVTKFARRNEQTLRQMPVAVFSVGLEMQEDRPDSREKAAQYLKPITDLLNPVSVGLFGGVVDKTKASFPMNLVLGMMPQGDWRDWDAIHEWARALPGALFERRSA